MAKRTQPGLYPTVQKKAEWELRRYQMLELYKGGATEKQIGETMGLDKAYVHRSIKRVLNDLAVKYSGMADQIRGLQTERYTTHRISEINGVIPKEPLITIDQRAIHLTQGEVTFSIEAASGNYLNGNGPDGDVPETQSLPETTGGDILG